MERKKQFQEKLFFVKPNVMFVFSVETFSGIGKKKARGSGTRYPRVL